MSVFAAYSAANLAEIAFHEMFLRRPSIHGALSTCAGWLIGLTVYALALPWFIQADKIINLRKPSSRRRFPANPEARVLLFGYAFFMGPSLYGVLLYHLGMPALLAAAFPAASIITGVAWGIHNMRAS